jgi:hypothetical protein
VDLLTAILVLPLLFVIVAAYAVLKFAALMLHVVFAPVRLLALRR